MLSSTLVHQRQAMRTPGRSVHNCNGCEILATLPRHHLCSHPPDNNSCNVSTHLPPIFFYRKIIIIINDLWRCSIFISSSNPAKCHARSVHIKETHTCSNHRDAMNPPRLWADLAWPCSVCKPRAHSSLPRKIPIFYSPSSLLSFYLSKFLH